MPELEQLAPDNVPPDIDPSDQVDDQKPDEPAESEKAAVKLWLKRLERAENKYKDDFERMQSSMDFVWGIQWNGQKGIEFDKYVANWTIRTVNQGVATLYARNPQVEVRRDTNRLNYQVWDGKIETIHQAMALFQMSQQFGLPLPPDIPALLQDFQNGRIHEAQVDRVAKTLQYLCQKQLDMQTPDFKTQMKQLVRRVNVCGVGYIKVSFCREDDSEYREELTQSKTRLALPDRVRMAKSLLERIEKGKIEESNAEIERLKMLVQSFEIHPLDTEARQIRERIVLDFPRATSIIPDPGTRTLKGFVGAHWVAEKTYWPLRFVNEYFEVDIEPDSDIKLHDEQNKVDEGKSLEGDDALDRDKKKVCVYVVHDLDTKSTFTLCKGHKEFLCEPEAVSPAPRDFWTIFPVTFNDVEVEEGCKATIFPPSLVDLIKPTQKEWNRTRQALRRHRKANGPKYMYIDGTVGEDDLDRIVESEDQEFVKLKGVPPGTDPSKVVVPLGTADIKKELYDNEPLREDTLLASGQQEANQGPPQPNITATGVNVAEQSRMGVAASDIDGLDDCLTSVVDCSAQLMLMEMSSDTVKKVVGPGAVWPDEIPSRRALLDEVEIKIKAASTGKPNQAVELNKWQAESQILMNFGANPQAVIRETISRFDDHLEPADFFPLPAPPQATPAGQPSQTPNRNGQSGPRPAGAPNRQQPKQRQIQQ